MRTTTGRPSTCSSRSRTPLRRRATPSAVPPTGIRNAHAGSTSVRISTIQVGTLRSLWDDLTTAALLCTLIAMAADPNMRRSDWLRASPPMFDRPWMDRFTRIHPAVVPLIFVPTILIMAYIGADNTSTWRFFAYLVVGYGLWTLTEYWLHRVIFHFEPEDGLGAKLHWLIHGVHHEHPNDPNRLVMPPSASIPLAAIFLLAYRVLFSAPDWLAVSAGFLLGYVVYDTMHWYLHHRIPRSRVGRRLRELHLRHHFQDDTRGFGISAPYWDRVFRTAPVSRRKAEERRGEG